MADDTMEEVMEFVVDNDVIHSTGVLRYLWKSEEYFYYAGRIADSFYNRHQF